MIAIQDPETGQLTTFDAYVAKYIVPDIDMLALRDDEGNGLTAEETKRVRIAVERTVSLIEGLAAQV